MDLMVISAPDVIANEALTINQLFKAGLTRFHLRKPKWNISQCIQLLQDIDQEYYPNIAIHQHHMLRDHFNIKRFHYPEKLRACAAAGNWNDLQQNDHIRSTSVHQLAEIPLMKTFEYVFFSPVFNSLSKPGYQGQLQDDFMLAKANIPPKVIALGGINESNLTTIRKMNFDGAAALGAIWNKPEKAVINFKKLNKILNN
ncbi:thiamine phosphate synthase [Pedobacter psychrotolerans]|uniref:thiamine phosphate synthase n=1 Tax=Pedobacter psychrotolerans TaxID=1843235 RepID=UPI003F97C991